MGNPVIEQLVAQVAEQIKQGNANDAPAMVVGTQPTPQPQSKPQPDPVVPTASAKPAPKNLNLKYTVADYPIMTKHPELVITPTNKSITDITLANVDSGSVVNEDCRISSQMLLTQADVAASAGKTQVAENLARASELTQVPDDVVIKMYDMLRPNRATKQQLEDMAVELEQKYNALRCAKLVREALAVYETRGILLK